MMPSVAHLKVAGSEVKPTDRILKFMKLLEMQPPDFRSRLGVAPGRLMLDRRGSASYESATRRTEQKQLSDTFAGAQASRDAAPCVRRTSWRTLAEPTS
jgi:hypothetical protein